MSEILFYFFLFFFSTSNGCYNNKGQDWYIKWLLAIRNDGHTNKNSKQYIYKYETNRICTPILVQKKTRGHVT